MFEVDTSVIPTEEARIQAMEQFNNVTAELSLKHTFSFDEMWDNMVERRKEKIRQDKFKTDITKFEEKLKSMPGSLGADPFPLVHIFSDGLYIRQLKVPAKTLTVTKIHKQEHAFFLMQGTISVLTPEGIKKYTAPFQGITKVGTKRVIYHHDEVIFTTVHATDKKTVEEVEHQVIATDFSEVEGMELELNNFMNIVLKED